MGDRVRLFVVVVGREAGVSSAHYRGSEGTHGVVSVLGWRVVLLIVPVMGA